jgi:hypothetical protein
MTCRDIFKELLFDVKVTSYGLGLSNNMIG